MRVWIKPNGRNQKLFPSGISLIMAGGILATAFGLFFTVEGHFEDALTWRPSFQYLLLSALSFFTFALVYFSPVPRLLAAVLILGAGAVFGVLIEILATLFVGFSAFSFGILLKKSGPNDGVSPHLTGMTLLAIFLFWLGLIPINHSLAWGFFLLIPIVVALLLARRPIYTLFRALFAFPRLRWAEAGILSLLVPHFFVALMPEIGHDALVTHLALPAFFSEFGFWAFNPEVSIAGTWQIFVDLIFALGFMFGGEIAARLLNLLGLIISTRIIFLLSLEGGASRRGSFVASAIYLTTPVLFLESSSLFVENWWAAFLLGGVYKFVRMNRLGYSARDVLELGLLIGAALAAKAVSVPLIFAGVILSLLFFGFPKTTDLKRWLALTPGFIVGVSPYTLSYYKTGNPVFPFFNSVFQSPYFPSESFANSLFPARLSPDIFYLWTFNSGQFLEGSNGSAGFQWLILVIPAVVGLLIYRRDKTTFFLVSLAFAWVAGVFFQTSYLRYVIPAFGVFSVLVGVAWSTLWQRRKKVRRLASVSLALAIGLNLVHLNAATWYGRIDYRVLLSEQAREEFVAAVLPVRGAINEVNERNTENSPVAFFGTSAVAYIKAQAIHTNWYNPNLNAEISGAANPEDIRVALRERGVEYLIVNTVSVPEETLELVEKSSNLVFNEAGVAVRMLEGSDR